MDVVGGRSPSCATDFFADASTPRKRSCKRLSVIVSLTTSAPPDMASGGENNARIVEGCLREFVKEWEASTILPKETL